MRERSSFVAVDWGTSNLRATVVVDGEPRSSWTSTDGVAAVHAAWKAERRAGSKERFFIETLERGLSRMNPPADLPRVVSGMASSSLGLRELPYASLPFMLDGTGMESAWIDASLLLLSGVAGDADVMRGEETQLIGLRASGYREGLFLLPGTHSKHVWVAGGRLERFETHITGELFHLLIEHSTIGSAIRPSNDFASDAFAKGVEEGFRGALLHRIFTVRAQSLLGAEMPEEGSERLSGMLIGHELKALAGIGSTIYLAGKAELARRYLQAGRILGLPIESVSVSDWDAATWRGQQRVLEQGRSSR